MKKTHIILGGKSHVRRKPSVETPQEKTRRWLAECQYRGFDELRNRILRETLPVNLGEL